MTYPAISEHFVIPEFVPPEIWNAYGSRSIWFIDYRIVQAAEKLMAFIDKPLFINTWHRGGRYFESGYRLPDTLTGARFSQHKSGRAVDIKITGIPPEEMREIIRQNWATFGITTIEADTPSWTHIDIRNTGLDNLLEVPYK